MRNRAYQISSFIWIGIIFCLCFSKGSSLDLPKININGIDKAVHFVLYFVLNTLVFCWIHLEKKWDFSKSFLCAVLLSNYIGVFVEWVQENFITGRSGDINDLLFNSFGIFSSFIIINKKKQTL